MTYRQDFTSRQTKRRTTSAKHPAPKHPALGRKLTKYTKYGITNKVFPKDKHIKKETRCLITIADLQNAAAKYSSIKNRLQLVTATINPVEMVTPANLLEVKAEWIDNAKNGIFINPRFHYDYANLIRESQKIPMLINLKEELIAKPPIFTAEIAYYEHLLEVINDAIHTLKAAKAIVRGDDQFTAEHLIAKYGRPSQHSYQFALNLVENGVASRQARNITLPQPDIDLLESVTLDAQFIKEMFIWAMEQYDQPWPVEIIPNCSAIDVRDKNSFGNPIIVIPSNKTTNGFKLTKLIGHEIECHWRGSKNAEQLGIIKVDSEFLYEGVAKLKDWQFGADFMAEAIMPQPYYVIAERQALMSYSFAEVGKNLAEYMSGDVRRAWSFTYRTFRGITDARNTIGYAFTKDRAYLEGYLYAQQLIEKGNEHLLNFSTLSNSTIERMTNLVDKAELERVAIPDRHIQSSAMHEILRRIKSHS